MVSLLIVNAQQEIRNHKPGDQIKEEGKASMYADKQTPFLSFLR
jgi:hypothetical protein